MSTFAPPAFAMPPVDSIVDTWKPSVTTDALTMSVAAQRERVSCGFQSCSASSWTRLWRRNGRPTLDGRWGCSRACLDGLVERALHRELSNGADGEAIHHRHRVPLGLVLLAQGWITQPQLQHALAAQRASGRGRIGDWLVDECGVAPQQVTRGLGVQWGCPVLHSQGFSPSRMALVLPQVIRQQIGAVPLQVAGGRMLYLGFAGATDPAAALAVERMTGTSVECGLLSDRGAAACVAALDGAEAVACETEMVMDVGSLRRRLAAALGASQPVESKMVRIGNAVWLRMWLEPATIAGDTWIPSTTEDVVDRVFQMSPAGTRQALL